MKLSIWWSILGFFLPIIGIFIGHFIMKKNEMIARSRRGSALSTIIVVLAASFLIYYFALVKK